MYSGYKVNTSINKSTVSGLNETQLQSLQRQVDTYTRKLQVQKRKFFAIQDQHKTVTEQYTKQKQQLNKLKKQSTKAQSIILQAKVKNIQATLDKAVSSYDDTIAYNNKLKSQIDMLRRQKKNYIQMQRILEQQLNKVDEQTSQKMQQLNKKKKKAEQLKQQINQTKTKNQQQRQAYINKFSNLEKQYVANNPNSDMSSQGSRFKNSGDLLMFNSTTKPQIIDTQPLLKFRLKRVIASNKQKLRLIEQYKKHMMQIQQAFNEIKQKSNISDLDEITTMFIKSQQQNYSLYNYMDELTQNIDKIEEENKQMQERIRRKTVQDQLKREGLMLGMVKKESTGDQSVVSVSRNTIEKQDSNNNNSSQQSLQENSNNLITLVNRIKPALESALIQLAQSPITNPPGSQSSRIRGAQQIRLSLNINDRNIEEYLSELERHIHLLQVAKQQAQTKTITQLKDGVTVYTKPIPAVNYQQAVKDKEAKIQQKDQGKFWDQGKFRQYAMQFWQKRKATGGKGINQLSTNQQLGNINTQAQISGNSQNNSKQLNISSIINL